MKFLFVFAIVAATLGMTTQAHAECPLAFKNRLLLSDISPKPDAAQDSSGTPSKDAAGTVGKTH